MSKRNAFVSQEPAFDLEQKTATLTIESTQSAMGGNDAVAGHNQWIGVGAARLADSARRIFELGSQLTVGLRLPGRNGSNARPDTALKVGAGRAQGQGKAECRVGQPARELAFGFGCQRAIGGSGCLRFKEFVAPFHYVAQLWG